MICKDLDPLFSPRAVAVVGASQDLNSVGGQPVAHLKNHGYQGRIYPVNPKYPEIGGYKTYASVRDLPERPDLALILLSAARAPEALRECGEMGIPFAIIFSSGFSETGEEGARLQQQISEIAAQYDIGVVGPNCQGMMNIAGNVYAGFGSPFRMESYRAGAISMVSQSGGFGYSMVGLAEEAGLGFRKIISIGNEAGLNSVELMRYYVEDAGTKVIVTYLEGLRDATQLVELGGAALQRRKAILVWKVGKTQSGQKASAAHTGNLGGDNALYEAAFRQKGMIPINDLHDLVDYSKAFLYGKHPRGNRVAVVSASGGAGVVLADQCSLSGLELPSFAVETTRSLQALLPSFSSVLNPIDPTASVFSGPGGNLKLRKVLQILLEDPNVDSLIVANSSLHGPLAAKSAQEIVDLDRTTDKPIFVSWSAREKLASEAFRVLADAGIPHYQTPVRCGRSLGALAKFAEACRREDAERAVPVLVLERPGVRHALRAKRGSVSEHDAKALLREYGIICTSEKLAASKSDARLAARDIGYPVAIKVQSADLPHKTEAGAVHLGIRSDDELDRAYDAVLENARRYNARARIDGVLVQEMVHDAVEVILGIVNKPQFGPAVMFGLGGIFTEILKDVSFRFAPVNDTMALEMIREIRGYRILEGARGGARADVEALAATLAKLSAIALDLKDEVAELDINPLFVFPGKGGVKAGDALITLRNATPQNADSAFDKIDRQCVG